ncbi:hypothetical protein BC936DRAFT_146938 [Jimgerdemannia flammicorona]|uniref:Uncharacterized protein n=1 Tax=Jimgerdemannia flammicorona TaxID=994334 RepID=A0A433D6K9_9FUNG|nr:hypothetical protein BC936DRAFT_146938 [Jimgerdemannia flammicorona]
MECDDGQIECRYISQLARTRRNHARPDDRRPKDRPVGAVFARVHASGDDEQFAADGTKRHASPILSRRRMTLRQRRRSPPSPLRSARLAIREDIEKDMQREWERRMKLEAGEDMDEDIEEEDPYRRSQVFSNLRFPSPHP